MANLRFYLPVLILISIHGYGISLFEAASHEIETSDQIYRTAFHFQPAKYWMNDPNGPMIYMGIYHFFYQYNPYDAQFGNIVWGHSTSTDLVNWTPQPPALLRSEPYDFKGCFSGSTTILSGGKPAILYTGVDFSDIQVQNLAVPKNLLDPYLIEWVKSPFNPIITPNSVNKIDGQNFRDPTTAWLNPTDGYWRMVVGNKKNDTGIGLLYKSKNFIDWIQTEQPLHFLNNSGMLECPDFFPVSTISQIGLDTSSMGTNVKHVFKASVANSDYYTIGKYDPNKDIFIPDNESLDIGLGFRYDYGKYYASKTFFDSATNRRILFGWVNESVNNLDDINSIRGWAGLQGIPRRIWLQKSGNQLLQWPIVEIEKLRMNNPVVEGNTVLMSGSVREISGVTATQADVEISFAAKTLEKAEIWEANWTNPQKICSIKGATVKGGIGPFGLLVLASDDMQEYTAIFFRIFKGENNNNFIVLMCSDQSRSSLHLPSSDYDKTTYGAFLNVDPVQEKLSLRTLIDHSIVESFGGEGKACITARVYPTNLAVDGGTHLYVFNNGSENVDISNLTAWSMKTAQIN
uniref:Beta-fructofuranosidase, insoluble isoenzyme CWINV1-like n=2 Tax=Nicotiana TaxID=4085 RepID=A0A1S3X7U9_TOBAC|nr:PREDICTED: beta-fructofuranosidase, insoluble isoenzyme CWINV1-like [Nicotiana sylvestris]XP_016435956.1 PREDICTED: beta-fructofuranosidase, insoluble isoenzyme CWINV1-like [Nicotiana tabacum]